MLKKRNLGKTKLRVSEIGLGCWQLGGYTTINHSPITFGDVDEKTATQIINNALDFGINVFDTADYYSLGNSEIIIGRILKKVRSDIHIFTKAGAVPSNNYPFFEIDLSYEHLIAALRRSLKRLQTNYVDLFQIHKVPKTEKDFINVEKAFKKIKTENMALYCGASIGVEYESGIELIKREIVDSIQLYFSLIDPKPLKQLFRLAKKYGVGIIVAEPLAQGLLTGKYSITHNFSKNDMRSYYGKNFIRTRLEKSKQFSFLINDSRTLNQVALAYILSRDEVSTCIPGVTNVSQLKSNLKSSSIILTKKELQKISKIQKKWL